MCSSDLSDVSDQPVGARPWPDSAPEVDAFATAIIERVADRWTLLVLELLAEGLTNRQIGERLFLAEKTVKNYVSNLLQKLGMERRTQAAVYASKIKESNSHAH